MQGHGAPPFDDVAVNTMTFVALLNVQFSLPHVYETLAVTASPPATKKRARGAEEWGLAGAVTGVKLETATARLQKGRFRSTKAKPFRNSLAVDMFIGPGRKLNLKLSANGGIQLTGPRSVGDALCGISWLIQKILPHGDDAYTPRRPPRELRLALVSVMRNVNFSLGFQLDRQEACRLLQGVPGYRCLFAPQFCYAGLNVKKVLPASVRVVQEFTYAEGSPPGLPGWRFHRYMSLEEFAQAQSALKGGGGARKILGDVSLTFLVFQSGKVIMSGPNAQCMREAYREFNAIMDGFRGQLSTPGGQRPGSRGVPACRPRRSAS